MPIQIQCAAVVIRNDALDRALQGGWREFNEIAPNAMSYSDDMLSQASFMSPVDAEEFAKSLELRGLNRDAASPDFVIVSSHNQQIEPECAWLLLFEYEHRLIATMRGNPSRKVIAPAQFEKYGPGTTRHYSAKEIKEQFEFVQRKDGVDTYRNKETGQLVYHTRKTETTNEVFQRCFKTVWQLRREPGMKALSGDKAAQLIEAIGELQSLAAKHPGASELLLALGMAWYAVGNTDSAMRQLTKASRIDPENTLILKELGGVCLHAGEFATAVEVARKAVACRPDDPELMGNLAVSQLLAGRSAEAKATISYALNLDVEDKINQNVRRILKDIEIGNRPYPKSLSEMMRCPETKEKRSFLSRLFGG